MTFTYNDRTVTIPTSWNDLHLKQLLHLFALFLSGTTRAMLAAGDDGTVRIEAAKIILDLSDDDMEAWRVSRVEEYPEDGETLFYAELKEVVAQATQFLFVKDQETDSFDLARTLTRNPYRILPYRVKGKKQKLYGPGNGLENLTFGEIVEVFTLVDEYNESSEEQLLDEILALLWRPGKRSSGRNKKQAYGGDRRQPFAGYEATVPIRAKMMKKLPPLAKGLMYFWLDCCRKQIIDNYPQIFKPKKSVDSGKTNFGWGGVLLELSGGIAEIDKVSRQPYQNAFAYLTMLEVRATEAEMDRLLK